MLAQLKEMSDGLGLVGKLEVEHLVHDVGNAEVVELVGTTFIRQSQRRPNVTKKLFSFATRVLVAKQLLHVAVGGLATVVVSRGQQAGRVCVVDAAAADKSISKRASNAANRPPKSVNGAAAALLCSARRPLLRKQHNMMHTSTNKKSPRHDNCRYSTVVVHFTCNEKVPCSIHGDGLVLPPPGYPFLPVHLVQFRAFFDHQVFGGGGHGWPFFENKCFCLLSAIANENDQ